MIRKHKKCIVYLSLWAVLLLLNLLAWNSTAFCDWYIDHVFQIWVGTLGRVTGVFPFSVGEWMILAGVALLGLAAIGLLLLCAVLVGSALRRRWVLGKLRHVLAGFYKAFAWILLVVSIVMTLNCFVLYHASTFSKTYFGEETKEYTPEEILGLYNRVAAEANELYALVERDAQGMPVPAGDMKEEAKAAMQKLGETYSRLSGWYPSPKAMTFSDFMCQQHMQGYYFPFSMEANYNDVMGNLRKPATLCHELAHLRGYIFEDEANFIGYLACLQSDDPFFRYGGNMSVLNYVYQDLVKVSKKNPEGFAAAVEKHSLVQMREEVWDGIWQDFYFVSEEDWERINKKALFDTEKVDKAADTFVETNLKVNGVSDGAVSYSRVVQLLLQYYRHVQAD